MHDATTGAWAGWGPGDNDPKVSDIKAYLRRMYKSYAGGLDNSPVYDAALVAVVSEAQRRLGLPVTGIFDYATQVATGYVKVAPPPKKVVLFTVQGAGVDMWTGYQADTARALLDIAEWQPIGNFPAAAFPMKPSVDDGIKELRLQIRRWANLRPDIKMALIGYSEGSLVTGSVWKNDIANPHGMLHDLLPRFVVGVTWGFPMRELGMAHGNELAGDPVPDGQGIVDNRMTSTPDFWYDFAHGANGPHGRDLYTDTPVGETGLIESAIWHIVSNVDFFSTGSIVPLVISAIQKPEAFVLPIINAILEAGMFFVVKGLTPHTDYDIGPAIDLLRGLITAL